MCLKGKHFHTYEYQNVRLQIKYSLVLEKMYVYMRRYWMPAENVLNKIIDSITYLFFFRFHFDIYTCICVYIYMYIYKKKHKKKH